MAVNVSTIISVCLYCKTNSETAAEKDFHDIYDDVGLELQLHTLVETYFNVKVKNDTKKYLCDDCVNRLIELYDLDEHAKEKRSKATDSEIPAIIKVEPDVFDNEEIHDCGGNIIIESEFINDEEQSENFVWEISKAHTSCENKPNGANLKQSDIPIVLNKSEYLKQEGKEKQISKSTENVETLGGTSKSAVLYQEHSPDDIDIDQSFLEEDYLVRNEKDMALDVINPREPECNEYVEFVEDEGDQNMVIEIMVNRNVDSVEELEFKEESEVEAISKGDQIFEAENEKINTVPKSYNESSFMKYKMFGEKELESDEINLQTVDKQEPDIEDIYIEEVGNIYNEDDWPTNEENECENEITSDVENEIINYNSEKRAIQNVETFKSNKSSNQNITENIDIDQIIGEDQDEISNDAFSLEEEYLIEETICSEDYDNIDLNEYLENVLVTQFKDLLLNWKTECKLCLNKFETFEELIKHSCIIEFEEEQQFCCIIKDCDENINNLSTLARHLVLKHYDKLESTSIYGKCPDCQKTFSNIIDFNKHSCCRNIKRKAGSPNYCQYCDMDFQSLKRYVFHMQFHLTNHRPKVCLLCGHLFNNSNDFFEHTQYQHTPKTAMACIKCDRFFKEKDVFDSHMELHEDSKYQYQCNLCPKKYTNKFGLKQHKDICHNNKCNALKCSHCEKEFVNKASYRNHIKSHATDVQVETFICSICGIITNSLEFIKNHIKSDADSPCFSSPIETKTLALGYTCENCSLDFLTIKHLKEHRLSESHSDDLFHCVICRQRFKSLRHMRNHSTNHKTFKEWLKSFPITRFFVCNIGDCQEFYPIWTSLYYHKKRPHKTEDNSLLPNEFKCQFCHQLCSSKMSLAVHVARSHNNSNIKCTYCKRTFKCQQFLQDHIDRFHTPVECDVCLKKFKHRRNLESHQKLVHLNLKRYFCKHCEKGYFHKSERDIHEKKVHPDIPYKCEICNFVTNYPDSLEIHMDKHNNQLKFKCTICSKAFGRKQLLQCHLKRHLNKKDYSCAKYLKESGCDAMFMTYNLLKKHIKTKHENSSFNINMQNEEQRKKTSNKRLEIVQIENISYKILDCEDDSRSDKSPTSTLMNSNVADFEEDDYELVLENDV